MEKIVDKRLIKEKLINYKKFAFSFSAGMALLLIIALLKNFPVVFITIISFLLAYHLICGFFYVEGVFPFYITVTSIGKIIGIILTNTIFTIVFYLLFTPLSLLLRLFGKDKIRKYSKNPVWLDIEEKFNDPERIRHLY